MDYLISTDPIPYVLIRERLRRPQRVFWLRIVGPEEAAHLTATVQAARQVKVDAGLTPRDPRLEKAVKEAEVAWVAAHGLDRIVHPDGSVVETAEEIEAVLRRLPASLYEEITSAILGSIEVPDLEGKGYASPSC